MLVISCPSYNEERECLLVHYPLEVRMKKVFVLALLFFSAAILLSIGFSVDSSHAADSSKIAIAYSSNIMGYLEPCG